MSPDRKEFFSTFDPQIRFANKDDQEKIVADLMETPEVAEGWDRYCRDLYRGVHFIKDSGRYRLIAPGNLGKGDFNVYRTFVEAALQLTKPGGYAAQVVPGGFYGGANAMAIRRELYGHGTLTNIFSFINTAELWFRGVDSTTRFAAYTAHKGGSTEAIEVAFALRTPAELNVAIAGATTTMSVTDIREQSPQALAIGEVTDATDAALAARLSKIVPSFGDANAGPPHGHYQREVDMGTDRDLFADLAEGLPLYEGRMVNQFDHRAKAYRSGRGRAAVWEDLVFGDPHKGIVPQWRVTPTKVPAKLGDRVWRYRFGWCDVTSPRNERSLLAALIPPGVIAGHSVPTFVFEHDNEWGYMPWLVVANSFVLDYLVRRKVSLHLSLVALDSLPMPRLLVDNPAIDRISRLALLLTCTAPEMTGYWNAMAAYDWCSPLAADAGPPGLVDPDERASARAQIDAVVAKELFAVTGQELAGILDTFPVLRRREEKPKVYGEFRTKRLVLEAYDNL